VLFANVEIDLSVFALAFQNGMQYCHLHKGVKTSDDAAISCKKLVNFCAVTSEIMFLICVPLYGYLTKIGLRSPFVARGFPNALEDLNVNGCV